MKEKAPRNQTISLSEQEAGQLQADIVTLADVQNNSAQQNVQDGDMMLNHIACGDFNNYLPYITDKTIDLLILDPPYNLSKNFNGFKFNKSAPQQYQSYLQQIFLAFLPKLKPSASIYICGDWLSSVSIYQAAAEYFTVRNRISWEREKGRGAKANWKNCNEDIWFCTLSDDYIFNVDAVKLRRKVIAPYKTADGMAKDWYEEKDAESINQKFRDTSASNFWSDITIPFWSMPENTDHPTQKSEKLLAKLILASSHPHDVVCDPFLGSGTTAVVAQKLQRNFIGIELNPEYCLFARKRLQMAVKQPQIQGFKDGVFWERNSANYKK